MDFASDPTTDSRVTSLIGLLTRRSNAKTESGCKRNDCENSCTRTYMGCMNRFLKDNTEDYRLVSSRGALQQRNSSTTTMTLIDDTRFLGTALSPISGHFNLQMQLSHLYFLQPRIVLRVHHELDFVLIPRKQPLRLALFHLQQKNEQTHIPLLFV